MKKLLTLSLLLSLAAPVRAIEIGTEATRIATEEAARIAAEEVTRIAAEETARVAAEEATRIAAEELAKKAAEELKNASFIRSSASALKGAASDLKNKVQKDGVWQSSKDGLSASLKSAKDHKKITVAVAATALVLTAYACHKNKKLNRAVRGLVRKCSFGYLNEKVAAQRA